MMSSSLLAWAGLSRKGSEGYTTVLKAAVNTSGRCRPPHLLGHPRKLCELACQVFDAGGAARPVLKAHSVADLATDLGASLLCHAPGDGHRGLCQRRVQIWSFFAGSGNGGHMINQGHSSVLLMCALQRYREAHCMRSVEKK